VDSGPGDEMLLAAVAERDMGAFRTLYDRHTGLGAFKLLHGAGDPALDPHRMLGFAMAGAAIIILILTLIARPGARAIVGAVLLVLMTAFLQSLLAGLADDHVIFGALHATDGLLILAIPAYLYVWTGRRAA
jgi:hypothetical protein